jgi:hypothetical protein
MKSQGQPWVTFPLPLSLSPPPSLRDPFFFPALLPLSSGGATGWSGWGRRGQPSLLYSCRIRLSTHVEYGAMPLEWSGLLDLFGQIGCVLGFVFFVLRLQWSELEATMASIASLNKAEVSRGGDLGMGSSTLLLFLSCRGGEGKQSGAAPSFFKWLLPRRWIFFDKRIQLEATLLRLSLAVMVAKNLQPPTRRPRSVWSSTPRCRQVVHPRGLQGD